MSTQRAWQAKKTVADAGSGLQDLIERAEDLLESMKDQQGAAVETLRSKVSETIQSARTRLSQLDVPESASNAVDGTVGFLRSVPWRTVAIGALAVLAISALVRSSEG